MCTDHSLIGTIHPPRYSVFNKSFMEKTLPTDVTACCFTTTSTTLFTTVFTTLFTTISTTQFKKSRKRHLKAGLVRSTELRIYDSGPAKILEYIYVWDRHCGKDYHVLAVFETRDGTRLKAYMPVDTYAKSKGAKALAGS